MTAELEKLAVDAVPAWKEANTLRENDPKRAVELYKNVVTKAPNFDHALRRICHTEPDLSAALAFCEKAIASNGRWENHLALTGRLIVGERGKGPTDTELSEADRHLLIAKRLAPEEPEIVAAECMLALRKEDEPRFSTALAHLKKIEPNAPRTKNLSIIDAMVHDDIDRAEQEIDALKGTGIVSEELVAQVQAQKEVKEHAWTPARLGKLFLMLLGGWLVTLAALLGLGALLSRGTLHAIARIDPREGGEAVGGTATMKRLYGIVVAAAGVIYYLSLPLIATIIVGIVGGLTYVALAAGIIPIKLLLVLGLMALATLGSLAKAIYYSFVTPVENDPGILLLRSEQPAFHALLAEVAERCGTRPVDHLILTPGTDFAVYERGSFLQTTQGRGVRCMLVGAGLLRGVSGDGSTGLRVGALKGILAHEYGHFRNKDTAGGAFSLAARRSMTVLLKQLVAHNAASAANPAWLFALNYFKLYLRISQGATRLQEVLADRWAIKAYGTRNFIDGFVATFREGARFETVTDLCIHKALSSQSVVPNLYAFAAETHADPAHSEELAATVNERCEAHLEAPASAYDSHPRPKDRIAAAEALAITVAPEPGDDRSAWLLFEHREHLEAALTEQIADAIFTNHGAILQTRARR